MSFAVQQFAVPLVALIVGWIGAFGGGLLLAAPIQLLVAAIVAPAIAKKFPSIREAGQWVWVIPSCFLLLAFIHDTFAFSLRKAASDLFYPPPIGESQLALMLLTIPTLGTIFYSLCLRISPPKEAL